MQVFGIFLIIAFAQGFFIIYHPTNAKQDELENPNTSNDDKNEENPFIDYFPSFVITTLWSVGEIDSGFLITKIQEPFYHFLANMFTLTFFFMIVLVYMNFLNGLAVSDVGELKEGAQIRNQILRVDIIYHMEKLFLHPLVRKIMEWFKAKPSKIFLIPEFQQKKLTFSFNTYGRWRSWRKIELKDNRHIKVWMPSETLIAIQNALLKKTKSTDVTKLYEQELRNTKEEIMATTKKDINLLDHKLDDMQLQTNKDIQQLNNKLNKIDEMLNQILLKMNESEA